MMEKPSPYVFRTTFSASQVPTPLAKFTYDKLKARTATVIAGDTVGTIELVMGFARAFEEAGGKVVQDSTRRSGPRTLDPLSAGCGAMWTSWLRWWRVPMASGLSSSMRNSV